MSLLSNLETADALVREIGEDRVRSVDVNGYDGGLFTHAFSLHLVDRNEAQSVASKFGMVPDGDYPDDDGRPDRSWSTWRGQYRGVTVLLFGALREVAEVTR